MRCTTHQPHHTHYFSFIIVLFEVWFFIFASLMFFLLYLIYRSFFLRFSTKIESIYFFYLFIRLLFSAVSVREILLQFFLKSLISLGLRVRVLSGIGGL